MTAPFRPSDLLLYRTVGSIAGSPGPAACAAFALEAPREESDDYLRTIWLARLDGSPARQLTVGGDSAPSWSPDGSQLAFVSDRGEGGLQAYILDIDGGEAFAASRIEGGVSSVEWSPDGRKLLIAARQEVDSSLRGERGGPAADGGPEVAWRLPYKADGLGFTLDREIHLFLVDKAGGEPVQLTDGPFDVRAARFSPDGAKIAHVRTRVGRQAHGTDVWLMDADGSNPVQLSKTVASAAEPRWSPDGRWIAFTGAEHEGDSRMRLWLIDVADGSVRPLGDETLEVEAGDGVHWSEDSQVVYFILVRRGLQEIASIRVADGDLKVLVSGPRHVLKLALAPGHLVYAAAGIDRPVEVFACGRDGQGERTLTALNAWWDERAPPRVAPRTFEAPNGDGGTETIEGWLALPPSGVGPFPLLVDVHGGPHSIAHLDFGKSVWRHVLCSRGWAVLALNPVGSSSYDLEFMTRLRNRWGELDLPQHLAAIRALQDEGTADERLAIYGKSYGGYLAAWAITQCEVFKAAVVSAPVSNIESHFGTSDSGYYVTPYAMSGEPFGDRTAAHRLSPLNHMHKASTPTLLLQGKDDERCPVGQSEEIFATLIRSGETPAEMVLYPGAGHHLAEDGSPKFRVDYVTRLVEWVERWAGARQAAEGP